jgi:predicted RNase H-like HicB family nuclease
MPASTSVEDYILAAFKCAVGEALDDGTFVATIPELPDIIAYGNDSHECWRRLYGLLEETVRLWLAQGHPLPVLGGIHLDTV